MGKGCGGSRVGTYILCKLDQQLFRRSTRGASGEDSFWYNLRQKFACFIDIDEPSYIISAYTD